VSGPVAFNPAFNYDQGGQLYAVVRRPDPRIASIIHAALGDASSVLNLGAGSGSYEPTDRHVTALEPSEVMRKQRPKHLAPALIGTADAIPFDTGAFDAAMAVLTVHHWSDRKKCLQEVRRVTRGPFLIVTFDPDAPTEFWMGDYVPELVEVERKRYGSIRSVTDHLGGSCQVHPIDVPQDCTDGFQVAFYARPEAFLQNEVRKAQSAWSFLAPEVEPRFVQALTQDLTSGRWDQKYGHLRARPTIHCQLRLIVANP
jgi:SAM-dependent methyltransferase